MKKALALILCLVMLLGVFPMSAAFAEGETKETASESQEDAGQPISGGIVSDGVSEGEEGLIAGEGYTITVDPEADGIMTSEYGIESNYDFCITNLPEMKFYDDNGSSLATTINFTVYGKEINPEDDGHCWFFLIKPSVDCTDCKARDPFGVFNQTYVHKVELEIFTGAGASGYTSSKNYILDVGPSHDLSGSSNVSVSLSKAPGISWSTTYKDLTIDSSISRSSTHKAKIIFSLSGYLTAAKTIYPTAAVVIETKDSSKKPNFQISVKPYVKVPIGGIPHLDYQWWGWNARKTNCEGKKYNSKWFDPSLGGSNNKYKVTANGGLYLREEPNTNSTKGPLLSQDSIITIEGATGTRAECWAKVIRNGRTYYASMRYLSKVSDSSGGGSGGGGSSSATYLYKVNASGGLKLRKTASTSGTVLTTMAEGTMVYVKSISNGWAYVYYKKTGQWGYASVGTKPYLVKTTYIGYNGNMKVTTSGGKLNLRTGPGTGYSSAYQVSNGTTLHVVGYTSSWAYVYYNGGYYYASKTYLK